MKLLNLFSVIILNKHNKMLRIIMGLNPEPFDMNSNTYPQRYRVRGEHEVF